VGAIPAPIATNSPSVTHGRVTCPWCAGGTISRLGTLYEDVYVIPALVLAVYGPRRLGYRILGAALVVGLFGWWPVAIGNQGGYDPKAPLLPRGWLLLAPNRGNHRTTVEFTWRGLDLIVGNYYVLTLLVFIAATACALVLTRRLTALEATERGLLITGLAARAVKDPDAPAV
jgi:hypothetical protein